MAAVPAAVAGRDGRGRRPRPGLVDQGRRPCSLLEKGVN